MAKQKEMMPLLGESMRSSMKPMFVILPMFLIVYYVLIPMIPFGAPGHPEEHPVVLLHRRCSCQA